MGRRIAVLAVLAGLALAAYGFWEGVPERDIADAVHRGDRAAVQKLLARDAGLARAKVYPQGMEPWRTGRFRNPATDVQWSGRYLVHDTVGPGADPAMLALLAEAGADLSVRLEGRTLLHEAARSRNPEAAAWLLDHGADVNAPNDCSEPCAERGRTPLHDTMMAGDWAMTELLLSRGASLEAALADGQRALHLIAGAGLVDHAWVLCRYGADTEAKDGQGRTPRDVAHAAPAVPDGPRPGYGPGAMAEWLVPGGGCDTLSARARASGSPVSEDEGRVVFGAFLCARGVKDACAAPR